MARFRSFAKINLSLEVGGRRSDGYHELRTVFQTIDLADDLEIEHLDRPGIELEVSGADLAADERNLAHRAARLFFDERLPAGAGGIRMRLEKRIPVAAGLGGGSSNAATTLLALGRLFELPPDPAWLDDAARRLGADVPFFLIGGTALGTGRGDVIEPLGDAPAPVGELVLLLPPWGSSTPEVFAGLAGERAGRGGRWDSPPEVPPAGASFDEWLGENDLEGAAFRLRPALGALYTAAARSGARRVRMSGSGSSLIALFDSASAAAEAARQGPPDIVWRSVRTLGRAAWRKAGGWDFAGGA